MADWMELGIFAGKILVLLTALVILILLIANIVIRSRHLKEQIEVEDISKKYQGYADFLKLFTGNPKETKKELKKRRKSEKKKKSKQSKKAVYVIDFEGDIRASQVDQLRDKISAALTVARPGTDEVLVRVNSPGGMVHTYGLAAAQLLRFRENNITTTISVDKIAASGGYLMACTGHKIIASPFAILGSIGVVAQVPNLHRLLKKHNIDYEEITAGDYKRTVSLLGEITEKGRQKFLEQIEGTHELFKEFVGTYRPQLDLTRVATGEHWYGKQALELGLVDDLISSDEYLFKMREEAQILKIDLHGKRKLSEKLADAMSLTIEKLAYKWWQKLYEEALFKN